MINECNPAAEAIDAALFNLHKHQCATHSVPLGEDTNEEAHQLEATADVAYAMLSHLANATCPDCMQSLADYSGKHGDHYDALLMELFEQVTDEMIRRIDEKTDYSDEPDPIYTRDDLVKALQDCLGELE